MIRYIGHGQFVVGDHSFGFCTHKGMRPSWRPSRTWYRSGELLCLLWWRFFVHIDFGSRTGDMVVYGSIGGDW